MLQCGVPEVVFAELSGVETGVYNVFITPPSSLDKDEAETPAKLLSTQQRMVLLSPRLYVLAGAWKVLTKF